MTNYLYIIMSSYNCIYVLLMQVNHWRQHKRLIITNYVYIISHDYYFNITTKQTKLVIKCT